MQIVLCRFEMMRILTLRCAVVVNREGKLEEAVEQINNIITAEKHRSSRIRWQDADVMPQEQEAQAEMQPSLQC